MVWKAQCASSGLASKHSMMAEPTCDQNVPVPVGVGETQGLPVERVSVEETEKGKRRRAALRCAGRAIKSHYPKPVQPLLLPGVPKGSHRGGEGRGLLFLEAAVSQLALGGTRASHLEKSDPGGTAQGASTKSYNRSPPLPQPYTEPHTTCLQTATDPATDGNDNVPPRLAAHAQESPALHLLEPISTKLLPTCCPSPALLKALGSAW